MPNPTKTIAFPDYLLVAEEPLSESTEVIRLSLNEIKERFGLEYSEQICNPNNIVQNSDVSLYFHWEENIKPRLETPLNESLVVCKVNDVVGYGLFTREPIKAGTVVGLYAGELKSAAGYTYGMCTSGGDTSVCADNIGGIARFILHMPEDVESVIDALQSLSLPSEMTRFIEMHKGLDLPLTDNFTQLAQADPSLPERQRSATIDGLRSRHKNEPDKSGEILAIDFLRGANGKLNCQTANVRSSSFVYEGTPIIYMLAMCDIPKFGQLGISYGMQYWRHQGYMPVYFGKGSNELLKVEELLPPIEEIKARYKRKSEVFYPEPECALRRAASCGVLRDVAALLAYGVNINAEGPTSQKTALQFAIKQKQDDVVRLLRARGAAEFSEAVNGVITYDTSQYTPK